MSEEGYRFKPPLRGRGGRERRSGLEIGWWSRFTPTTSHPVAVHIHRLKKYICFTFPGLGRLGCRVKYKEIERLLRGRQETRKNFTFCALLPNFLEQF